MIDLCPSGKWMESHQQDDAQLKLQMNISQKKKEIQMSILIACLLK